MITEIDFILKEVRRRGYYGYKPQTDSHKVWIVDSYDRPNSLRCDSIEEAWQSFLTLKLSTPEEYALRVWQEKAIKEAVGKMTLDFQAGKA